jgi:hypothetical protein
MLFKTSFYLNKCDLLTKYLLLNINESLLFNNFSLEHKIINTNLNSSIKEELIKFSTLLAFYFLSLRFPFFFIKKKNMFVFKLNFVEKSALYTILEIISFEKILILKKKFINNITKVGLNVELFLPNFSFNTNIDHIFEEFTFLKIQHLKLKFFLKINSSLTKKLEKTSKEQLFYNYNLLWLFNLQTD